MPDQNRNLKWQNIALMGFVMVWGFGNVVNNFANQGLTVVFSWIFMIALYFVPYTLMVGELGSAFKDSQGGVSAWIKSTTTPMLAFMAGWTYWVVHVPYLAQKPQSLLIALSWAVSPSGDLATTLKGLNPLILQGMVLVVFLVFLYVSTKGIKVLKVIGNVAGTSMFVMSLLYIVLGLAAPAITGHVATPNITPKSFVPKFDFAYLTTLSMLVFAVGGCEKIAPYVNNTKNPSKNFPKGMLVLAGMVAVCALLGSIAMGMMFNANAIPEDLMMNGQYYAFQLLGEHYGLGSLFVIVYALANTAAQLSALVFSIDAPLRVLLGEADSNFIPKALSKTNKNGVLVNGYIMTAILVSSLIIVPALGIGSTNDLFESLLKLNAVVMPMRYLWVFLAYMGLKKMSSQFKTDYKFIKSDKLGFLVGLWCFGFTAFACIMGMFSTDATVFTSEWVFKVGLNIITPLVLMGIGLILPVIAKRTNGSEKTSN
ncbi:amino acid permease [Paraclostridium ghonii]|uniref:Amino acid transporter n=1 Tax=Paraclostridium ghonii TaxID=29358 RepID=A0ABU0N275_9FIRM|nr:amino acid permease [Paeniclostridium ghonii]MCM0165586.1 amino acid permease [Paeniclostridium ghonii]MDQ0557231.1 amino acid transporter [Paeniclostridium ghonii]